jgi:hypothetical protein
MDTPTPEPGGVVLPGDIELVAIDRLVPYARNSRTHSDEQVAQIAASMREFGFTNPVLLDADDGIVAGHGRVLAARKLGMPAVPCLRLGHLTDIQRRAYVIADNKLALNANWDKDLLRLEMEELALAGIDTSLTGWGGVELESFLTDLDDWQSDIGKAEGVDPKNTTAKGKLTVSFDEHDREELREAITNCIDSLGLEGVSVT